ncbi:hypothetical protein GYO_2118 [Bacillus spizizenii TU-B-10]|uniref:Uncharacterized protein n=1 Tax=Bacillus spizizenii (strain DSM 15029 / JCM 12233 / NBRC 101239 / NRRL B-23049 / TU-B-10) TaxID=1052585 RepID=G4NVS0_BACS4|nr:hypothetical protein GYO_2118 [Bacillus spizizenii TU-B-10]
MKNIHNAKGDYIECLQSKCKLHNEVTKTYLSHKGNKQF